MRKTVGKQRCDTVNKQVRGKSLNSMMLLKICKQNVNSSSSNKVYAKHEAIDNVIADTANAVLKAKIITCCKR